jgi:hypothetical protein
MKYIIEVQKICESNDESNKNKYEHFGYINCRFTNTVDAKKYVRDNNPQLKFKGNRRSGYLTSTDLITNIRFLIRIHRDEKLNLPPF